MSDLSATMTLIRSRGRTAKSKNAVHLGFRYSQDGKLRKDGSQSWRCVKKDESKGLSLTETPAIPHNHEADFIDAETKEIYSAAFTFLCGEIPLELGLDDFLAYFSSTWVQGFAGWKECTFPS